MVQTVAAEQLTLYDLERKFSLQRTYESAFFSEWQGPLPTLTALEQERLARVRQHYRHLGTKPVLEGMVKMVVVSPLLDLAGFFDPPFYSTSEASMQLTAKDGSLTVRGKMDVLVLLEDLWVLVIESKRAEFSIKVGIPQVLAYMLAAPQPAYMLAAPQPAYMLAAPQPAYMLAAPQPAQAPRYGLVTNGNSFTFLKLAAAPTATRNLLYGQSDVFDIERGDDLPTVVQILKQLGNTIRAHSEGGDVHME
jgi:hypothetical protein